MLSKIVKILEDVLECDVDQYTSIDNCDEWDSMNHVNIILELQEEFNIKIPFEEIDKLKSLKAIEFYINNLSK